MPTKRKTSLQCRALPQTCQPAKAEGDERDQRHQAGDDPVAGLVGDRLDVGGKGSRAASCASIIRVGPYATVRMKPRPTKPAAADMRRADAVRQHSAAAARDRGPDPRAALHGRVLGRDATAGDRRGDGPTFYVRSPRAAAHVLRAPGQLGLGRAYVSGELEVDDMDAVIGLLDSWKPPPLEGADKARAAARRGAGRRA